eukprot:TRINITY_DN33854_c0_g1_i1.p1 TRINITY_DN33854_c0_g1~~TRINITY_DN33854_c0_g1_i1.p1  ORF type:complete len:497 (+),score=139.82 TRINITY_DN33854_c0_g1_i1:31-1521(+)
MASKEESSPSRSSDGAKAAAGNMEESSAAETRRPQNREQWMANVEANMQRAKSLTVDVLKRLRANESADALNKEVIEAGQKKEKERIKKQVRGRVKEHTQVISGAQRSIREIEEAMTQVMGCQGRLVQERYARFADQKVCERRLEIREKRPPTENFRDAVQEALEREKTLLNSARQELLVCEDRARAIISDLEEMRTELSRDTGARRLQVETELANMKMQTSHLPQVALPGKQSKEKHEAPKLLSEVEAKVLYGRAEQVIHSAGELQQKTDKIISKSRQDAEQAAKRSGKTLAVRTRELAALKKQCEDHLKDVEHATHQAKQALGKEESKLENMVGAKAMQETQSRINDLNAMVKELQATRRSLVEELRSKAGALDIDNSCRRVTPQMASEPKKQTQHGLASSTSMPALAGPSLSGASSSKSSTDLADAESSASTAAPVGTYLPAIHPKSPQIKNKACCQTPGNSCTLRGVGAATLSPSSKSTSGAYPANNGNEVS